MGAVGMQPQFGRNYAPGLDRGERASPTAGRRPGQRGVCPAAPHRTAGTRRRSGRLARARSRRPLLPNLHRIVNHFSHQCRYDLLGARERQPEVRFPASRIVCSYPPLYFGALTALGDNPRQMDATILRLQRRRDGYYESSEEDEELAESLGDHQRHGYAGRSNLILAFPMNHGALPLTSGYGGARRPRSSFLWPGVRNPPAVAGARSPEPAFLGQREFRQSARVPQGRGQGCRGLLQTVAAFPSSRASRSPTAPPLRLPVWPARPASIARGKVGRLKGKYSQPELRTVGKFDLSKFKSVVVYWKRFRMVFSTADSAPGMTDQGTWGAYA